jgi:hypothetical protein
MCMHSVIIMKRPFCSCQHDFHVANPNVWCSFKKQCDVGGAARSALAKSVQQFSSYETTRHKNPNCLTLAKAVRTHWKFVADKKYVIQFLLNFQSKCFFFRQIFSDLHQSWARGTSRNTWSVCFCRILTKTETANRFIQTLQHNIPVIYGPRFKFQA